MLGLKGTHKMQFPVYVHWLATIWQEVSICWMANRGQNEDWVYSAIPSSLSHSHPLRVATVSFRFSLSCSGLTFAFLPLPEHSLHCCSSEVPSHPLSLSVSVTPFHHPVHSQLHKHDNQGIATSLHKLQICTTEVPWCSFIWMPYKLLNLNNCKINSSFYTKASSHSHSKYPEVTLQLLSPTFPPPLAQSPCGGLASQMTPNESCLCRTSSSPEGGGET